MKILIISGITGAQELPEVKPPGWLLSLLEELEIPFDSFYVERHDKEAGEMKKQFFSFFDPSVSREDHPTHVLIHSFQNPGWIDFLAGFSLGSTGTFLVYGEDTIAGIPAEIAFCFLLFTAEDTLRNYLKIEKEASKETEASIEITQARNTLLERGIPVTEKSFAQCTDDGELEEIGYFIAAGFSPDTRNKAGVPLLNIAARKGYRDIILLLLKAGAHVSELAEDRGSTALLDAAMCKHLDIVNDLIAAGTDVNVTSKDGQNALIVAVGTGDNAIVETLAKAGADPDVPDKLGVSARKYAGFFHNTAMLDLFNKYAPPKKE
jgi:hypothetical protein